MSSLTIVGHTPFLTPNHNLDISGTKGSLVTRLPPLDSAYFLLIFLLTKTGLNRFPISNKVGKRLRPIFVSKKIKSELRVREKKPALLSKQCVVYKFQCDQCEAVMSVLQLDTCINGLKNIRALSWESILKTYMEKVWTHLTKISLSFASVRTNLIA
jgi:hypothetical protein